MLMYFDEELTLFGAYSGNWQLATAGAAVCCPSGNVFSVSNHRNFSLVAFKCHSLGPHSCLWVELAAFNSDSVCYFQHHVFSSTTQFLAISQLLFPSVYLITINLQLVPQLQFTASLL